MNPRLGLFIWLGTFVGLVGCSTSNSRDGVSNSQNRSKLDAYLAVMKSHPKQATLFSAMAALDAFRKEHRLPFLADGAHGHYTTPEFTPKPWADYPYPQRLTFTVGPGKDHSKDHLVTLLRESPASPWKLVKITHVKRRVSTSD